MDSSTPPRARILVVDDERSTRDYLVELFRGIAPESEVVAASNGFSALAALDGPPDLVLADYRMPGMDGVELLARIHARHGPAPSVLITGYPDEAMAIEAINRARVDAIVVKPWNAAELVALASRLLRDRRAARSRAEALAAVEEGSATGAGAQEELPRGAPDSRA